MVDNMSYVFRAVILTTILTLCLSVSSQEISTNHQKPNVLIIFTDDQGYGDLGCYGSRTIFTPQIDRFAEEGTRFTSFYAQSVCGPSRSALLTGRYPIRSKGWCMPAEEVTFAEKLKEAGYQTACIGKWDVSSRKPIIERMPQAQGFDYYFGTLGANDDGFVTLYRNNEKLRTTDDMAGLTRLYTEEAIEFLKYKRDPGQPFLLYLAHTMAHMNIDATPHFKGKSGGGLYGDVIEEIDHETGRLLDVLERLGLKENTLVIFASDNGPWSQSSYVGGKRSKYPEFRNHIFWGDAGPLRNAKGSCYEGGYRVPCIVRWPGKVPAGRVSDAIIASVDFFPTFATLAAFSLPEDRVIDGVDQTGLLTGTDEEGNRRTFLYARVGFDCEGHPNGVRKGKWKYLQARHEVFGYAVDKERPEVEELYNLEEDIGELKNLAEDHPEKLREMRELFEAMKQTMGSDGY